MIRAIVTDIEGTTTSIAFVHDTLFPFARARMRTFLEENEARAEVRRALEEVSQLEGRALEVGEATDLLLRWIDEDRKVTPLKSLQGMIWREGYASGALQGHVYDDTPGALRRWHDAGKRLYVYSSGSVEAQQLIFGHTAHGDLTPMFSGYFDTGIGHKREAASYLAILQELSMDGEQVLFLSDIGEELDAAREAGMRTCQLVRDPGLQRAAGHPQAATLDDVTA